MDLRARPGDRPGAVALAAEAPARDARHVAADRPEARRSFAFWLDDEPYWLLLGVAAGVFEIIPIIGPLVVGILAVGVGLTASWETALGAGTAVLVLRQAEDLFVAPRVLGHAVGLSPLVVLVSVTAIGILFGGFYVLLAIPIAAVVSTLVDVILRGADPAEEEVPP
ncbi:MAG: AI-2E family transporter, partial [Actinobacteria bacterium]